MWDFSSKHSFSFILINLIVSLSCLTTNYLKIHAVQNNTPIFPVEFGEMYEPIKYKYKQSPNTAGLPQWSWRNA